MTSQILNHVMFVGYAKCQLIAVDIINTIYVPRARGRVLSGYQRNGSTTSKDVGRRHAGLLLLVQQM